MRKIFLFLLSFIFTTVFSQINYEKGYFIKNNNEKIECYIRNSDWENAPEELKYKDENNTEIKKIATKDLKEFGIDGFSKFVKEEVEIDNFINNTQQYGYNKDPEYKKKETVFLKVLKDGNLKLLYFRDGVTDKYFYQKDDASVKQLIYKKYLVNDGSSIAENNYFRKQLKEISAGNPSSSDDLKYTKTDLLKYFSSSDNSSDDGSSQAILNNTKSKFNLNIRPGINFSGANIQNTLATSYAIELKNQTTLRFGVELEYILPFHKNKWGIILEPTYQYFKSTGIAAKPYEKRVTADFSAIEIPFGVRHYFFLNNESKIFVNASYILANLSMNKEIVYELNNFEEKFDAFPKTGFVFGIGYNYKSKYAAEIRTSSKRTFLEGNGSTSDFSTTSLIVSYNLF